MHHPLTDTSYLQSLLKKERVAPDSSLGQNFLICSEVVEAYLMALTRDTPRVTELGSGAGVLTQALLQAAFSVRAIERDERMVALLHKLFGTKHADRLHIMPDDLRTADWTWPEPYQLAGNIPYNLSGYIIRHITQLSPERAVLLVQREVGERLCADVPQMQLITLAVHLWGRAERLLNVPATCFWPQPKVSSQLVLLVPRNDIDRDERERVMRVARLFFQSRRKQIGGVLRRKFGLPPRECDELLAQFRLDGKQRPQEVPAETWRQLAQRLAKRGVLGGKI